MRFIYYIIICFFLSSNFIHSQQITVNNTVGLEELIENNLENGCIEITNITSSVNGSTYNLPSYGYFEQANSNFPFESGIVLSTGNANSAGNNPINNILTETHPAWGTDLDIESTLGITNTTNATSIEFNLITAYNILEFNYIFASEEYEEENACNSQDSFVILIREANSSDPYQNIALIPGTIEPITVSNIREEINPISCPAQNNQHFAGFNIGDTNFKGRTAILNASTNITPQTTYQVKLIIADQPDGSFDSAVFIQSNIFNPKLELGPDFSTCRNSVDLSVNNIPSATYEWFYNNSNSPISGATNATYIANQDGNYKVVSTLMLNGLPCSEEDDINIVLNTETIVQNPEDFRLCDDPNNGTGEEIFILSEHETYILDISTFSNTDITYHTSSADARDINSIGITTANNLINPTIFLRLHDIDNNCYAYSSFNLVVNTLPNTNIPNNLLICDENGASEGITSIDLSILDEEITINQPDLEVTYHTTDTGAVNGDNSIPDKTSYINTDPTGETIYARVLDTNSGCIVAPIPTAFDIFLAPDVNSNPEDRVFLDACDSEYDGFDSFNLEDAINDIVGTLTNYTPHFYENENDALAGNNNFIPAPTNYTNTQTNSDGLGIQVIYLRIQDNTPPNCATVVPFEIHTNLLLTGTDLGEFAICDTDTDANNTETFQLLIVESRISNDLPNPVTVTFYESEEDRTNDNPLSKTTPFGVIGSITLYLKLEDGNCTEFSDIILRVNPPLIFPTLATQSVCDSDSDGIVDIELQTFDDLVTGGNSNFAVKYFPTFDDANNNLESNEISIYPNANGTVEVHARIESEVAGISCSTISTFDITVFSAPDTRAPTITPICDISDGNPNGIAPFDLNSVIADLTNNIPGYNIQFYTSIDAAERGEATITNSDWIPNNTWDTFTTSTQEIFARVEDTSTGGDCNAFSIESFFIYVNTQPTFASNLELLVCKDNTINSSPEVILADYDDTILNGQTDKEVLYFYDVNFLSPIPKNNPITSFNGNVYVRIENITDRNGCYATATVPLVISDNPSYGTITPLSICESDPNGIFQFNLEEKRTEIETSSPDILNITFHKLESNAENNIQDIVDQVNYPGENNETLFIRIERDDTKCAVIEETTLFVFTIPETTDTIDYNVCDYNDVASFNLSTVEGTYFELIDRFGGGNLVTHYFKELDDIDQSDPLNNSNAITEPELSNFQTTSTEIFIKVTNNITNCFKIFPLNLNVVTPPIFNANQETSSCYNDANMYDLTEANSLLITNPNNYNFSYSTLNTNANITTNTLNYTLAGTYIIDVIIEDILPPHCSSTTSFVVNILPNPIANTPPDLISCDDNFDGILEFNLESNSNSIIGSQTISDYRVTYYTEETHAEQGINTLNNLYEAENGEVIYARIENINTGCFSTTQFTININPLPVIPIDDVVTLCVNRLPLIIDAYTGNDNDTYFWSTGETTSQIQLNSIDDIGDYSVTVSTPNIVGSGYCPYPKNFTVIESEDANINFTTTVDFADPNSITVDVSGIGDYVFILDDGEPQTSNVFNDVTFGVHNVTIRDLNGCDDVITEVVVVDIPKFITPNDDGFFDTWHIVGIDQIPGTVVYIYSRYGKLLKTLPHTSIGWDGTFNGENMPSDDYWFLAKVIQNGEAFDLKGHFALKR